MDEILRAEFDTASQVFFREQAGQVTKVWADFMGDRPYVRACFPGGPAFHNLDALKMLRDYMRRITGRRWVAVAYCDDMTREQVEAITVRLRYLAR